MKKQASPTFEAAFADLAYTYIKEASPKLMQFVVGFQVVEKNDDETRAVAVFGFEVDSAMFYAPVFFIKGELKGYDLLYAKEQDMFVPLEEQWVDYLISKGMPLLGEATRNDKPQDWVSDADISEYVDSPLRKRASAPIKGYWRRGELFDLAPFYSALSVNTDSDVYIKAAQRLDVCEFVKSAGLDAAETLYNSLTNDSDFSEKFFRFYSPEDFEKIEFSAMSKSAAKVPALQTEKVTYKTDDYGLLSEDELTSMITDGFVVKEREGGSEIVRANGSVPMCITTPTYLCNGGMFQGVCATGLEEVFISREVMSLDTGEVMLDYDDISRSLAVGGKDTSFSLPKSVDVAVIETASEGDVPKDFTISASAVSKTENTEYVAISEDGTALEPFIVRDTEEDNGVKILYVTASNFTLSRCSGYEKEYDTVSRNCSGDYATDCRKLVLVKDKPGVPMFRVDTDGIYMSDACRVIKRKTKQRTLSFVKAVDFTTVAINALGLKDFKLWKSASSYFVKDEFGDGRIYELSKRAMFDVFAGRLDCSTSAVHELCKQAAVAPANYFIKLAGPMDAMYDSQVSYDPTYGANVSRPVDGGGLVPGMETSKPERMSAEAESASMNPYETGVANGTPENKDVFDTAVIAGLVNTMRVPDLVDSYIGDLVVGTDRTGRLLFLFYWHNEDMQERYGAEEMSEFEETLRSTFSGLGKLVLFLKRQTADPTVAVTGDSGLTSI